MRELAKRIQKDTLPKDNTKVITMRSTVAKVAGKIATDLC